MPGSVQESAPTGHVTDAACTQPDAAAARLREALLVHTSTLGVRWQTLQRAACERRTLTVETPWGAVRCKLKLLAGRALAVKAEYEDCARAAEAHGVPLRQVAREAERLALAE